MPVIARERTTRAKRARRASKTRPRTPASSTSPALERRRRIVEQTAQHLIKECAVESATARKFAQEFVESQEVGEALIAIAEERGWDDVLAAWNGGK